MKWRIAGWAVVAIVALLAAMTVLTARPADPALWPPAAGAPAINIHVVSHGYHSGIIVERAAMAEAAERGGHAALAAVAQRFADYRWLEIGWGDEGFYRSVPDVASLTVRLAVRALFMPGNVSVVHVVGLDRPPRDVFPKSDIIRIPLSDKGFARMLDGLDASFGRGPGRAPLEPLGPGLYGPSLFYRGVDAFHVFNVCNHWVARLLSAAGVPTAPVLATLPPGLFLDLKWRAGLNPLPKP
jgi:uncharacterized protein (TIGR02117 family)